MKSTKKSLLLSTISLVLCFAMLLGTTWAWFTDEVTSGTNKIVAGNLDIEVSYKDNETWKSIQDVRTLFSSNLWEPGHTEYVTLKIENKGTLALTYKMMVTPVNEAGGINMAGQPFKLSDYLMFGTTEASDTEITYTRESARAAAGNTMKLNQAGLVKSSTMEKGASAQYVTLVVYMPETVGNEANYKTGTAAPTIDLGIKVVATQVENENDSFGNTYDAGAKTVAPFSVGPIYDYFPQVVKTVTVTKDDQNKVSTQATIEVNESETEGAQTLASVTVPVGVQLDTNVDKLTLKVTPQEVNSAYTVVGKALHDETTSQNREVANFDVKVEGVSSNNETELTVNVFIGKGLANVKIYHNGDLINGASYNSSTGIATFKTAKFSDYTMAYDKAVAAIGTQTYGTLELAIAAAQTNDTISLLKDVTVKGTGVTDGSLGGAAMNINKNNITLQGNGHTVTEGSGFDDGKKCSMFGVISENVTIENLTIVGNTYLAHGINLYKAKSATIKNVTVKDAKKYAVCVNASSATINGLTDVNCDWGGVNIDVGSNVTPVDNVTATLKNNNLTLVKLENSYGYAGTISATIESGTYGSVCIGDVKNGGSTPTISITGGSFTDLANAVKYAADNATIKLAKDAAGPGLMKTTQGNLTIDFGGHTYTMNNPAVGSTGTPTQAMHWERATVILKNGTFKVASGANNVKMAMQNYTTFNAENMVFDFTNINVVKYSGLTGSDEKYNGKDRIMFCNNVNSAGTGVITLKDSVIKMPADSQYGVCTAGELTLDNTKIEGSVCFDEPNGTAKFQNGSSATKDVVAYFPEEIQITHDGDTYTASAKQAS